MTSAWIDTRHTPPDSLDAVVDAAIHARAAAVVSDDAGLLAKLPSTVTRVLAESSDDGAPEATNAIALQTIADEDDLASLRGRLAAGVVQVEDDSSLTLACRAATSLPYTVVNFRDPTKIPLEIVIAAADHSAGQLICRANDLEEARIITQVLEKGAEGVLFGPRDPDEVYGLVRAVSAVSPPLSLTTMVVDRIEHSGLGDRVCVDTCTQFAPDEGMLVGAFSHAFLLCSSETHPLPYMPTRPFRVNAGALSSYVLGREDRTNYLSELRAGANGLAVAADGRTRPVVVHRIKLESRPLLTIHATGPGGEAVALAVQDDWHVRMLAPDGAVRNVTELRRGHELLGCLLSEQRHVGFPVGEFCVER